MYVIEDDKKMSSSFYYDLDGLLQVNNEIPINILYRSNYFYGNKLITIDKNTYCAIKIDSIPNKYKIVKADMEAFYKKHYVRGKKNIFYYGGHSQYIFWDAPAELNTNIFSGMTDLELIILDSCYTSYTNMLTHMIGRTKYVLASQTASANVGYLSDKFLEVLNSDKYKNDVAKYKKIIDYFILRNSSKDPIKKKFNYRTDGILIDMKKYSEVAKYLKKNKLNKRSQCKLEHIPVYNYYDLACITNDPVLKKMISDCVLYQKMNPLAKKFFAKKGYKLSGLNIGVQ